MRTGSGGVSPAAVGGVGVPPPVQPLPLAAPSLVALAGRPLALSTGRSRVDAGVTVAVASGARVWASRDAETIRVSLDSGSVELAVAARDDGRGFGTRATSPRLDVRAGDFRFVDLGTIFRVDRHGQQVELRVSEGQVAVWRGEQQLAMVGSGSHWSGSSAEVAAGTPALQTCAAMADGPRAAEALSCYRNLASGNGLVAETALYEAARLYHERQGDTPAAVATLLETRRRFPSGALRSEVDVTLLELFPRIGRHRQALDESAALLSREPRHHRAAELYLLRGNILRESFKDYARAATEYAAADAVAGDDLGDDRTRVSDDAEFFRAVCLEASQQREAARDAYRQYLSSGHSRHFAEARERLARLSP